MTLTYGAPILDANGKAAFSGHLWTPQHDPDPAKPYALRQGFAEDGAPWPAWRMEVRENDFTTFDTLHDRNRSEFCFVGAGAPYLSQQWFSYWFRAGPGQVQGWELMQQFHESAAQPAGVKTYGTPPFAIEWAKDAKGNEVMHVRHRNSDNVASGMGQIVGSTAPLKRAVWRRLVGCVVFDNAGTRGSVRLWLDGSAWVSKSGLKIGYAGQTSPPYPKLGLYRKKVPSTQALEIAQPEYAVGSNALYGRIAKPLPLPA